METIYVIMSGRRIVHAYAKFIDAIETKNTLNKELGNSYRIEEVKFSPAWKRA